MLGYDKLTSNMLAYTALRTKLPPEIRRLNKCFSSVIPATFYCCILPAVKLLHIVKIQMPVSFLTRLSQGLRSNETSCGSNGQYFRRDVVKLTRGMAEIGSVRCVHKMHGGNDARQFFGHLVYG